MAEQPRTQPVRVAQAGGLRRDRGKRPEAAGRKLYAGGAFTDTVDALNTPLRATMAGLGAVLNPAGGGFLSRYRNPNTSYGSLLREANPNLRKTKSGRVISGVAGFVGDVALDPSTYVGAGLFAKGAKATAAGRPVLGKALKIAGDPVGELALKPAAKVVGAGARKAASTRAGQAVARKAAPIVAGVRERGAQASAVKQVIRTERTKTGVNAANTARTVQKVKAVTTRAARKAGGGDPKKARAAEKTFREGVGRILDTGYDASTAAAKAARAEQAAALKKAKAETVTPARTKSARSAAKAGLFTRQADAAKAVHVRLSQRVEAIETEIAGHRARLLNTTDAAETRRIRTAIARREGQVKSLRPEVARAKTQADRLVAQRDKYQTIVTARKERADAARKTLTDPMEKAMRGRAETAAAEAAKAPALDAAVNDLAAKGFDPADIREALGLMQEAGNAMGEAGARAGLWSPATAARNRDVYAKRIYEKRLDPQSYLDSLRDDPVAFLREEARQHGGAGIDSGGGANPIGQARHHRKDLDETTREGLGEITDMVPRLIRGQTETGAAVARVGTLGELADRFAKTGISPEEQAASAAAAPRGNWIDAQNAKHGWKLPAHLEDVGLAPNRYVQAPRDAKYGDLAGKFVPHEVLRQFDRSIQGGGTGFGIVDAGMGAWKAMKVPYNPSTRVANRVSNAMRAFTEEGVSPLTYLRYAGRGAREQRGTGTIGALGDLGRRITGREAPVREPGLMYREAVETDPVFHGGLMGNDANTALRELEEPSRLGAIGNAARSFHRFVGDSYGRAENTDKVGLYMLFRDRGATPEEAAQKVRDTLFDYADAPRIAEPLSKMGMPFARYPSLAIPAEGRAFVNHPGRYTAMAHGVTEVEGMSDDPEQAGYEKQTMFGYQRHAPMVRMPWKDAAGRSVYADVGRFLPGGALLGGGNMVESLDPRNQPFVKLAAETLANRSTFTGRDITDTDLPKGVQLGDYARYIGEQTLPSLAPGGRYFNQGIRAGSGSLDAWGEPESFPRAFMRSSVGLTLRPVTPDRNEDLRAMEIDRREAAWLKRISEREMLGLPTSDLEAAMERDMARADTRYDAATTPHFR